MHSNNVNNFFKDYGLSIVTYRNLNKAVGWNRFMKRTFDLFFCMLALPFAIIVIIAFSLLIRLDSKGPVFYTQIRVGLDGRYFRVFKLRSMYIDAEKDGEKFAVKNDPRVTRIGRIMRKARIDELPQIYNILKGEMSFIGPRPERPMFTAQFETICPGFTKRLMVKPGLTGFAQINGGYTSSPKEKLQYDLYYMEHQSILLDFKILLKTIIILFNGDGAR
ncbi:sugar transferase [Salirhabdus sp. Marseille-P4669]|uniref:sugar transferase n=1 Tax=Salirhabdus sp. Marseille-P4669 TaxID=2042310 RepID=UPI001F44EE82|nr:sugar transferase [Salirhabdus sp. Marseille-P4669]